MLIRHTGIVVPKDYPNIKEILTNLTRRIYNWDDSVRIANLFIEDNNGNFIIPRFFPLDEEIQDKSVEGENIFFKSKITPRNERQRNSIEYLLKHTHGILKLEPGSGKTIIAIDSICKIQKKPLIIVHKKELLRQWIEELLRHTDVTEEDIGILKTTKFEPIFKKPILIGTVQTIISGIKKTKFLHCLQNSGIGVCFFDEVHTTIGPEQFSKASFNINCRRVYGLSATPKRFDFDDVLRLHLGEIKYFPAGEDETLVIPEIYMLYFPFKVFSNPTYKNPYHYFYFGNKFQHSRYERAMLKSDFFFNVVSDLIIRAFEKDRRILVLGKNIKVLIKLAKRCNLDKKHIGIFLPSSTSEQRLSVSDTDNLKEAFLNKEVVFGTFTGARDGNNRVDLDCLIMINTCSNVEQAVGRIRRAFVGKKTPIVLDLVDTEGPRVWSIHDTSRQDESKKIGYFERSAEKRKEIYKELKWPVKEIRFEKK